MRTASHLTVAWLALGIPVSRAATVDLQATTASINLSMDELLADQLVLDLTNGRAQSVRLDDRACGGILTRGGTRITLSRDPKLPCSGWSSLADGSTWDLTAVLADGRPVKITITGKVKAPDGSQTGAATKAAWCARGEPPKEPSEDFEKVCKDRAGGFSLAAKDNKDTARWGLDFTGIQAADLYWLQPGSAGWTPLEDTAHATLKADAQDPWVQLDGALSNTVSTQIGTGAFVMRWKQPGGGVYEWSLAAPAWSAEGTGDAGGASAGGAAPSWCKTLTQAWEEDTPDRQLVPYVLCVDLSGPPAISDELWSHYKTGDRWLGGDKAGWKEQGERAGQARSISASPYLLPDRPILVIARAPDNARAIVLGSGTSTTPGGGVDAGANALPDVATKDAVADLDAAKAGLSSTGHHDEYFLLAPRSAGSFDIRVGLARRSVDATSKQETYETAYTREYEFVVLQRRLAALRTGISVSWVMGENQREHAVVPLTATTGRVVEADAAPALPTPELVIGLAPFLNGGRYWHASKDSLGRKPKFEKVGGWLAPYVGLGLVSASAGTDVKVLSGYYLGLDIEPGRGMAISPAAVLRTGRDRIRPPYGVGSVVPMDSDGTSNAMGPHAALGFGVVLSVTPYFFRQVPGLGWSSVGKDTDG